MAFVDYLKKVVDKGRRVWYYVDSQGNKNPDKQTRGAGTLEVYIMYNYYDEVLQAVKDAVKNYYTPEVLEPEDLVDYSSKLNDALWFDDAVTGNASGSYFCNAYKAEEALAGNWSLAAEALEEFGYNNDTNAIEKGAEWVDVVVRCYMLNSCISDYIEQNEEELTERIERIND